MPKSKFSESQIVEILKDAEGGVPVADLLRKHGVSITFRKMSTNRINPDRTAEGVDGRVCQVVEKFRRVIIRRDDVTTLPSSPPSDLDTHQALAV